MCETAITSFFRFHINFLQHFSTPVRLRFGPTLVWEHAIANRDSYFCGMRLRPEVMMYQDIARLITHTQWFCMNQGGYNWMFKDTAWCNMTVQITPSKRMQWTDRGVRASEIVDILTGGVDNVPRLETSRLPEGPATLLAPVLAYNSGG